MARPKITRANAERLAKIAEEVADLVDEFKTICRHNMSYDEYDRFKYNCLGHLEPAVYEDSDWVTTHSSIKSLQSVAESMSYNEDDEEDDEEEGEEDEEHPSCR